jgi:glycine oxidase
MKQDIASGRRAEWLDRTQLRQKEPALSERVHGAVFYPDDAHVEPARLVQQVARVVALAGVEIRENDPVRKLEREGDRITAVHTNSQTYRPGLVVLAAGAWSGELADAIGLRLPTRPVKGQMLLADCRVPPIKTPLHAGEALLIPWPDGRLALGVTVEEVGFDDRVRLDSLLRILRRTIELVPAVGELALSYAWAGLRPATPDGWPYMGPVQPWKNLWISTGHFRKGTLLAPICAKLLAESIRVSRLSEELTAFRPERRIK